MDPTSGGAEPEERGVLRELRVYEALFQKLPIACVETSSRGLIVRANDEAAALFNVSRSFCIGKGLIGFVVRGDTRSFRSLIERVLSGQAVEQAQIKFRPRRGPPIVRVELAVRRIGEGLCWTLHRCADQDPRLWHSGSRVGSAADGRVSPIARDSATAPASPRVLCVEDDVDSREMLAELLVAEGFTVRTAATLREAVEAIEDAPFDIVLTNYQLPDGDGTTFIESLANRGRLGGACVVMITGHPRARRLSGVPCWMKPIDPRTLGARVRRLLV
jgi:PAS domain S-box-containing protein